MFLRCGDCSEDHASQRQTTHWASASSSSPVLAGPDLITPTTLSLRLTLAKERSPDTLGAICGLLGGVMSATSISFCMRVTLTGESRR